MENNDSIAPKVRALRIRSGLSMAKVAKALGFKTTSGYQHYEDPEKYTKSVLPLPIAQRLATVLAGKGHPPITTKEVLVLTGMENLSTPQIASLDAQEWIWCVGEAAAGLWREALEWPRDDWLPLISSIHDKRYPGAQRAAVRVRGDSMDLLYPDGSFVTFVRFADIGRSPQSGERVLAVRRRQTLIEATIKEFSKDTKGRRWLLPRSTNPAHSALALNGSDDETETLEIVGLVVASQRVE